VSDDANQPGRIFLTGGTGFVGDAVRNAFAGLPLRLLARKSEQWRQLESDLVEVVEGDVTDASSLRDAMTGCSTVVHLVAIIEESGSRTFDNVIRQGTENVVNEARASGIRRFIHMSALGASNDPRYPYHQAKWGSEEAVRASGLDWTIFRPSVIFGPGDGFIRTLAGVVKAFPLTPVVGDGLAKFQPIAVTDVAACFRRAVDDPATIGHAYDLGGPDILTYEQMIDIIAGELGASKPRVHLPVGLMKLVVSASSPLPKKLRPPVTREQLNMLAIDNSSLHSATPDLLGRRPLSLKEEIGYIRR
jgi:NADH dehydrogenase